MAQAKPVLNVESFQRLLTAAYMLQLQNDRPLSVQPIDTTCATPSAAGSVAQYQTQAVIIPGQELCAGRSSTLLGDEAPREHDYSGRLKPFEPIFLRNVMSWKTVEALAVAIVFCVMTGLSIHRLSADPGHVSFSTGPVDHRNVSQPARLATSVSASDRQTLMRPDSRQPGGDGDLVAKNTITHYQNRSIGPHAGTADRPGPMQAQFVSPPIANSTPRIQFPSERAAGRVTAGTVVQYGPDVTMWFTNPKRTSLARLTR
jgi:hypothetical protein